jgi:mannose-6-phosphate isomerase-like protein (cupin superfamily)
MTDTTPAGAIPAVTRAGQGEARWWLGSLTEILLEAGDTAGALSVLQVTDPPDSAAPLHVHDREDETFVILEGSAVFEVGDARIEAGPGDVVFGPRGVPHRYSTGPEGCRLLFLMTPGGFEDLVREMSVPAAERTLPPPTAEEPDWERLTSIIEAHHCRLL